MNSIATAAVKKVGEESALLKMISKIQYYILPYLFVDVYTNVNILNINNVVTWIQMTF